MKFGLPTALLLLLLLLFVTSGYAAEPNQATAADKLASRRIVFLGDSITQAGKYVTFFDYYLEKRYPTKNFEIYGLGLASETLSGLSEEGHAGGKFPRPCLFERLERLLTKVRPDVVFACYGINDGIYQPLDEDRFAAFQQGVKKLIADCKSAGVQQIYLVTPPIYDATTEPGEFNYDAVMTKYAEWEMSLDESGVTVIDLHSAMRQARDAQDEVFSRDKVHPGEAGHLLMAQTILAGVGVPVSETSLDVIKKDPLLAKVDALRRHRSSSWMKHVGYTREKVVTPEPLGDAQETAEKLKAEVDQQRWKP